MLVLREREQLRRGQTNDFISITSSYRIFLKALLQYTQDLENDLSKACLLVLEMEAEGSGGDPRAIS